MRNYAHTITQTCYAAALCVLAGFGVLATTIPAVANAAADLYYDEVIADSPEVYWRFNETSGTNADDATANNNDGTYTGSYTQGVSGLIASGTAVSLAGGSITGGQILETSGDLTYEVWVQPASLPSSGDRMIIAEWGGTTFGASLFLDDSGQFGARAADGNVEVQAVTAEVGTVYHLVATFNDLSDELILYVNGVEVASSTDSFNEAAGTNAGAVGSANSVVETSGETAVAFDGTIDEFAGYLDILSADRVTAHYQAGNFEWNLSDWTDRAVLTIDNTHIDDTLTDFPVYIDLADLPSAIWSGVRSDCGDIRVVASDESTELPRELVACDAGAQTGELHFKANSISTSSDTTFYLYYGNSSAVDYAEAAEYGAQNVWTNDYVGVWHMEAGSLGADSTSFGNDGTASGTTASIAGQVGDALDITGGDGGLTVADADSLDLTASFTMSGWFNNNQWETEWANIFGKGDCQYQLRRDSLSSALRFSLRDGQGTCSALGGPINTSGTVTDDTWEHLVTRWDGTTGAVLLNGAPDSSAAMSGSMSPDTEPFTIGYQADNGNFRRHVNGYLDEVRLASTSRSDAWISAEYTNQSAPNNFYSIELTQSASTWYDLDYKFRRTITIASTSIATTSDSFPVAVRLSDTDLRQVSHGGSVESPDGYDIIYVAEDDATLLAYEYESYSSTTGELVHWVNTSVSSTTGATFNLYYGKTGATDTSDPPAVWPDYFKAVYHLAEDPTNSADGRCGGGSFTVCDSTQYGNHGSQTNSPTASTSSFLGRAVEFDEPDNDRIDVASDPTLENFSAWTLGAWVYRQNDFDEFISRIISKSDGVSSDDYQLGGQAPGGGLNVYTRVNTSAQYAQSGNTSVPSNTWSFMTGRWDGSELQSYYNGAAEGAPTAASGAIQDSNDTLNLGAHGDTPAGRALDGLISFAFVADQALTDADIETLYTTTADPNPITLGDVFTSPKVSAEQRAYQFRNDEGALAVRGSSTALAATSTAVTDVRIGQRMNVFFTVSATGTASTTASYKLQFENQTDSPGTWTDVGTSTAIAGALGQFSRPRLGSAVIPTSTAKRVFATCSGGGTYRSGLAQWGNFPSLPGITLDPDECVDLAYAIDTRNAEAGDTYRLRLVDIDDNTLTTYSAYPTLTIESNPVLRASKEARGGVISTALGDVGDYTAEQDWTAVHVGLDGLPIFAYTDHEPSSIDSSVVFARCLDPVCSEVATTTIGAVAANSGQNPTLALDPSGLPIMAYTDNSNLHVARCLDDACSSVATSSPYSSGGGIDGLFASIAIGANDLPIVAHARNSGNGLVLTRCLDSNCTAASSTVLDPRNNVGEYASLAVTDEGLPFVAYSDLNTDDLMLARCLDETCSAFATSTLSTDMDNRGAYSSLALTSDGLPVVSFKTEANEVAFLRCLDALCQATTTTVLTTGNDDYDTSTVLGLDHAPHIAFFTNSGENLEFVRCDDPSCSTRSITVVAGAGGIEGERNDLVLDQNGRAVLSHYNRTDETVDVSLCFNDECATSGPATYAPTTTADLRLPLDATGYDNIALSDDVYEEVSGQGQLMLQTTRTLTQTPAELFASFEGRTNSRATTSLQVYRYGSVNAWETLDERTYSDSNSDFTLSGFVGGSANEYISPEQGVHTRVVQGTTTGRKVLKIDRLSLTQTQPLSVPRAYQFRNDEGALALAGSSTAMAATNTPLTNVRLGQRINVFFSVDSTGGTSTRSFKLQFENQTDASGTWTDVGTSTQISGALGQFGRTRLGSAVIPTSTASRVLTTCPGGGRYRSGLAQWGNFPSLPGITLGDGDCTDLAYSISTQNAEAGDTYRLRLVDVNGTALATYSVYPTLTIESNTGLRASKEARGGVQTETLDGLTEAVGDRPAITLSLEGYPVVAYFDATNGTLKLARCLDLDCRSTDVQTIDGSANTVGEFASIALDPQGRPVVAYADTTSDDLKLARCTDRACSSATISTVVSAGSVGFDTSIAITSANLPVISFRDEGSPDELAIVSCLTPDCSQVASTTVSGSATAGNGSRLVLGASELPIVIHREDSNIGLVRCLDATCTSVATSSLPTSGSSPSQLGLVLRSSGDPLVAYHTSDGTNDLAVIACEGESCQDYATTSPDTAGDTGSFPSVSMGPDGNAFIAYRLGGAADDLIVTRCTSGDCASAVRGVADTEGNTGGLSSLAVGADGRPVIAHYQYVSDDLRFARCRNDNCQTTGPATQAPTTTDELRLPLDEAGYDAIATSDDTYDTVSGASSTLLYQWSAAGISGQPIQLGFEGQVTENQPVTLEVYRGGAVDQWVAVAASSSVPENSDFTLTGTIASNLTDYYSETDEVFARVRYGTTTSYTTLSVDRLEMDLGGLTQRGYVFRNDEGALPIVGSSTVRAATNTPLTAVRAGERFVLSVNVEAASSSALAALRLQFRETGASWENVRVGAAMAPSQAAGFGRLRTGGMVLATTSPRIFANCQNGGEYTFGYAVSGGAVAAPAWTVESDACADVAFSLTSASATPGTTYEFRLVESDGTPLAAYATYPTLSISSDQLVVSKETRGPSYENRLLSNSNGLPFATAEVALDGLPIFLINNQSGRRYIKCATPDCSAFSEIGTSVGGDQFMTLDTAGRPIFVSRVAGTDLTFTRCADDTCASRSSVVLDDTTSIAQEHSIAIDPAGNPMLVTKKSDTNDVYYVHCNDPNCASFSTSTPWTGDNGDWPNVMLGVDGLPIIMHQGDIGYPYVTKCYDLDCTSATSTQIAAVNSIHHLAGIGADGLPVLAFENFGDVQFAQCNNLDCTSVTVRTVQSFNDVGERLYLAIATDGNPIIVFEDETDSNLGLVRCTAPDCSTYATSTFATAGADGEHPAVASLPSGYPIISHTDTTDDETRVRVCNNAICAEDGSETVPRSGTSDLRFYLDGAGYEAITMSDDVYDAVAAATSSLIYNARTQVTPSPFTVSYEFSVEQSHPTRLEVYRFGSTNAWEEIVATSTPLTGVDITLSGSIASNFREYFNGGTLHTRLVHGTTSAYSTLSVDHVDITSGGVTQQAYQFRNDEGALAVSGSSTAVAATSTAVTDVRPGQRMNVFFNLSASGTASVTAAYKLQFENQTDASGTWTDVGTSTQISGALGQFGRTRLGSAVIPTSTASRVLTTCPGGGRYRSGLAQWGNFPSLPGITLGDGDCTDLAYSISTQNAEAGDTYRLRLVDVNGTALATYSVYPTLTIESNTGLRASKEARGGVQTETLDGLTEAVGDRPAITLSLEGYPVVAYFDATNGTLKLARCLDLDCRSTDVQTIDGSANTVGEFASIALDPQGRPVVAYADTTSDDLKLARCTDRACSSATISTVVSAGSVGFDTSIAITSANLPVISFRDEGSPDELAIVSCLTPDCSQVASTTVSGSATAGNGSRLVLGASELPIVIHREDSNIGLVRCLDATCTSVATSSLPTSGSSPSQLGLVLRSSGDPLVAYHTSDGTNDLAVIACEGESCQDYATTSPDTAGDTGSFPSVSMGPDGNAFIAYRLGGAADDLIVTRCTSGDCASAVRGVADTEGNTGGLSSLAVGADGRPVIAHYQYVSDDLRFARCRNDNCQTTGPATQAPTTTDELRLPLDEAGYDAIATSDDTYDTVSGASSTLLMQWVSETDAGLSVGGVAPSWEGQVSEVVPVYLEVYRFGSTNAWVTLASETTPTADTDFTLAGTITENASEYRSGGVTYTRVRTGTTSSYATLLTDAVNTDIESDFSVSVPQDRTFVYGESPELPTITITDGTAAAAITASKDIRLTIPAGFPASFDSSVTSVRFSGSADVKVGGTVSYEDTDKTVVIDVGTDFTPGESLQISGLRLASLGAVAPGQSGRLRLVTGGSEVSTAAASLGTAWGIRGRLDLADHGAGQVTNQLDTTGDLSGEPLLTFRLTGTGEDATVDPLTVRLTGADGVSAGDVTNAALYRDENADGVVDGGDTLITSGSVTPAGSDITLDFGSVTLATGTRDYVVVADVADIDPGDEFLAELDWSSLRGTGQTSAFTIPAEGGSQRVYHVNTSGFRGGSSITGGGGGGSPVGGGTAEGGESLVGSDEYFTPAAEGTLQNWTNGSNAFSSDGADATASMAVSQDFATFNLNVPSGNTIEGIEVQLEAAADSAGGAIAVELSWNGGTGTTTTGISTGALTTSDVVYTLGGPDFLWGRSWDASAGEFENGSFEVRVRANPSGNTISLDALQVRVYSSAGSGNEGGGGSLVRSNFEPAPPLLLATLLRPPDWQRLWLRRRF